MFIAIENYMNACHNSSLDVQMVTHIFPLFFVCVKLSSRELILVEDEMTDTEDNQEDDLGVMEDQRSIILHLISQLKLGMDLTRV